ncbi:Sm-like ribonucleo protein [Aulographum hederae CBS 113979]|uniref:U6 snRNA-associated Sm-like protein LSm1 n=1 Tax=Aulographum hederae CBS 113979 TaxID=1176131 RepID=A0A6G1H7N7_9PEZI|nr:Sm-like ribonucleo protein [Aulographum hederae CBS 113979]
MFTTAAQLLDMTDKKIVVVLRDGRKLIGVLRSWDQFANIVLQDTIERLFSYEKKLYADIERGVFLVRGENVLLLGEIDLDRDDYIPEPYKLTNQRELHKICKEETIQRKKREVRRARKLRKFGFEGDNGGEGLV